MSAIRYLLDENVDMSIGETIEELWLMWAASREDEYRDRIMYLPLR